MTQPDPPISMRDGNSRAEGRAPARLQVTDDRRTGGDVWIWGVIRHMTWEETTDAEHRDREAAMFATLRAGVAESSARGDADGLVGLLERVHRVANEQSMASGIVVRVSKGHVRCAGSGRMGLWTLSAGAWIERIAPMIFDVEGVPRTRGMPLSGCLGIGNDEGRFARTDVPVASGDVIIVGLDGWIDRETLTAIPSGIPPDEVLRFLEGRTAETLGALVVLSA